MTTQYISYKPGGSAGAGTVTSVGLVAPAIFAVSGSPVTGSGNLTLTLSTEVANTVWAGPTTGADAAPTFRSLVIADLPDSIPYSKLTLTNSIVNADIASAAGITYSKLVLTGSIVNADVSASAAIALSKLAATTVSRALVSDGSGFVSPATTTATEISYVNGVTSSIQAQLNAKDAVITFSTGLTRTVNTVTVNTSQNIATLSNLTTNGFVKTSSGSGALSIDTNTYLTGNQTITLSGDVSGSGATAITTTIGAGKVTNTMLAGSIDLTAKVTGVLPVANGGTNSNATPTAGGVGYGTGTAHAYTGAGTAGQTLQSAGSGVPVWASAPTALIFLNGGNGKGSTNTAVRRFSNIRANNGGSDLSVTQSATNGDSITINTTGVFSIMYVDGAGATEAFGITVNGSALTTAPGSITYAQGLRSYMVNSTAGESACCGVTLPLTAGDVVRAQTAASSPAGTDQRVQFSVTRVA